MKTVTYQPGERVTVFVFDEATGGDHWPGTVRRAASDGRVKVRLDAGLDVAAHAADVEPLADDQDERRAA